MRAAGGMLRLLLLLLSPLVAPQPRPPPPPPHTQHTGVGPAPSAAAAPAAGPVVLQATAVAVLGGNATLDCTVLHLGDRQVSWVRGRDLQILSHAGVVFTGDSRVVARQTAADEDDVSRHWVVIVRARATDQGAYECQLNTEPKLSVAANLSFTASAEAASVRAAGGGGGGGGGGRVRVTALSRVVAAPRGGAARLSCACSRQPPEQQVGEAPLRVLWYRGAMPVQLQDGRISLESVQAASRAESRLLVHHVSERDGGHYRCQCERDSDTVLLTVDDVANDEALSVPSPRSAAHTLAPRALLAMTLTAAVVPTLHALRLSLL